MEFCCFSIDDDDDDDDDDDELNDKCCRRIARRSSRLRDFSSYNNLAIISASSSFCFAVITDLRSEGFSNKTLHV